MNISTDGTGRCQKMVVSLTCHTAEDIEFEIC